MCIDTLAYGQVQGVIRMRTIMLLCFARTLLLQILRVLTASQRKDRNNSICGGWLLVGVANGHVNVEEC